MNLFIKVEGTLWQNRIHERPDRGFSLIELLIAMTITLTVLGLTGGLLASSFNVRARENQKTDALADAQRALNIMTREIANTGFGLANNGIVAADSNETAIRVRANLNAFDGSDQQQQHQRSERRC